MTPSRTAVLLLALSVAPLARADAPKTPAPAAANTLCLAGEQEVFGCAVQPSGKLVSVCRAGAAVVYRFGRPEKIELQFPSGAAPAEQSFKFERSPFSKGVDVSFSFDNQGVHYEVQTHDNFQQDQHSAELDVTRLATSGHKKALASLQCNDDFRANWPALEGALPPGPGGFE